MKTIAIIGAGFCGLAAAWQFLQKDCSVHIYEALGIGGGASGISAGLLHSFAGPQSKLNWMGREGFTATEELLTLASNALGESAAENTGMLRIALTDEMEEDFKRAALLYEDISWLSADDCQKKVVGIASRPGIWIRSAMTVRSTLYLKGLWHVCQNRGAKLLQQKVTSLESLEDYDLIIMTTGATTLPELAYLPITPLKGQTLEVEWPSEQPPLPLPINSQAYILMESGNKSCLVGATFEHKFNSPEPDLEVAQNDLMPKAAALYPPLNGARIIQCRAGIRASTPDHKPLLKQIDAKTWVLSGMGSKGLLYHALFAKRLAEAALTK